MKSDVEERVLKLVGTNLQEPSYGPCSAKLVKALVVCVNTIFSAGKTDNSGWEHTEIEGRFEYIGVRTTLPVNARGFVAIGNRCAARKHNTNTQHAYLSRTRVGSSSGL